MIIAHRSLSSRVSTKKPAAPTPKIQWHDTLAAAHDIPNGTIREPVVVDVNR
jgi:hypothetical protein